MTRLTRPRPRLGLYEVPFWDYVKSGEVRLQRCDSCQEFRYPPGPSCPSCGSPDYAWEPISGRGELLSWTVFRRQYFDEIPVPYTVVAVATREGPILIANLVDADGTELRLGMDLAIAFEDVTSHEGDWRIYQWRPVTAGTSHHIEERP